MRSNVVSFFVEDGDAVSFGATAEAASDIVKNGDVIFGFEFCNWFRANRHAAELCAALQFREELVEFPAEALCFCSGAVLELALQFLSAEVVRQRSGRKLCKEILERRGVLCIHVGCEEADESEQDGRNCGGKFHVTVGIGLRDIEMLFD